VFIDVDVIDFAGQPGKITYYSEKTTVFMISRGLSSFRVHKTSFGSATVSDSIPEAERPVWIESLAGYATDHRYYDLVYETLGDQFSHRYLILKDREDKTRAIQPFLVVYQDLVAGTPGAVRKFAERVRRRFPPFLKLPMLMVGCSAGEGDLARDRVTGEVTWVAQALKESLPLVSKELKTALIVFKDFPRAYRKELDDLNSADFTRIPSMPATKLDLNFANFEEYLKTRVSYSMRKNLRKKFRKSESGPPIEVEAVTDITPYVDEVLPLYQQTLSRSEFRFEELNRPFLSGLGQRLGDRSRFLIWRQEGRIIAFAACLVHEGVLRDNYIGLDYKVALDYHLYFLTWRDTIIWALNNGVHTYHSAPLNYDPKYHFRMDLDPLDLYVRSSYGWLNPILKRVLPLLEPTRYDKSIQKFANVKELW
jgi:Acetyltransferase (GNAT) domain